MDYLPYGEQIAGDTQTTHKFTGKERDAEDNLDYFGARYYSSSMGRFMTPDWAEKAASVPYADFTDPQSLNLYTYVRDLPTVRFDRDGHDGGKATDSDLDAAKGKKGLWWRFWHWAGIIQTHEERVAEAQKIVFLYEFTHHGALYDSNGNRVNPYGLGGPQSPDAVLIAAEEAILEDAMGRRSIAMVPGGPILPGGMSNKEFGQDVMKWGTGDDAARARMQTLTKEELERAGVTKEIAQSWRDFYRQVKLAKPANPSAQGRAELMQKAYELLGGK